MVSPAQAASLGAQRWGRQVAVAVSSQYSPATQLSYGAEAVPVPLQTRTCPSSQKRSLGVQMSGTPSPRRQARALAARSVPPGSGRAPSERQVVATVPSQMSAPGLHALASQLETPGVQRGGAGGVAEVDVAFDTDVLGGSADDVGAGGAAVVRAAGVVRFASALDAMGGSAAIVVFQTCDAFAGCELTHGVVRSGASSGFFALCDFDRRGLRNARPQRSLGRKGMRRNLGAGRNVPFHRCFAKTTAIVRRWMGWFARAGDRSVPSRLVGFPRSTW